MAPKETRTTPGLPGEDVVKLIATPFFGIECPLRRGPPKSGFSAQRRRCPVCASVGQ